MKTKFKKGDQVRLSKAAKRTVRADPFWHLPGRHPSQCDGIGRVVGVTPPGYDQLRGRMTTGHVTIRFPTTKRSISLNVHPKLLERACVRRHSAG